MNEQTPTNPDADEMLALRYVKWHRKYLTTMLTICDMLDDLQDDPAFEDGEDLKDWVESIHTVLTFFPRTRSDIELEVAREYRKKRKEGSHGEAQHPQEGSP